MLTGQLGRFHFSAEAASASAGRGISSGQRGGLWSAGNGLKQNSAQWPHGRASQAKPGTLASAALTEARNQQVGSKNYGAPSDLQVFQAFPEANGSLPAPLYRLLDPNSPVDLPAPGSVHLTASDNRELDKLVAALGRNKATWRRAILLHEWLLEIGHKADDRLLTTLIRVCAQHGQITTALELYDWMRASPAEGGAGLKCTVYTYTAAMRAALAGNAIDKALQIWEDAETNNKSDIDCRLCTTLIEVYARKGDTLNAIATYNRMRKVPPESKLAPTVHAYTAVMRAAAEGGQWEDALSIWDDMEKAGCKPTGHAYAAAISACAAGGLWQRAVALFDSMLAWGIKPDVVSCTALVTALGADGQWERAEKVVEWMLRNDIRPNVRTYTALVSALANAKQWDRAVQVLNRMKTHALGPAVEPNAYTYSALLKAMGDHGKWAMAESVFGDLEAEQLRAMQQELGDGLGIIGGGGSRDGMSPKTPEKLVVFPGMRHNNSFLAEEGNSTAGSPSTTAAAGTTSLMDHVPNTNRRNNNTKITSNNNSALLGEVESLEERQAADSVLMSTMETVLGAGAGELPQDNQNQNPKDQHVGRRNNGQTSLPMSPTGSTSPPSHPLSFTDMGVEEEGALPDQSGNGSTKAAVAPSTSASAFSYFSGSAPSTSNGGGVTKSQKNVPAEVEGNSTSQGGKEEGSAATAVAVWTSDNAAIRGLHLNLEPAAAAAATPAKSNGTQNSGAGGLRYQQQQHVQRVRGPVNEVVCGALMLAYERGGKWKEAVGVLDRARALGINPNTVMYNTAMSALGKGGQLESARALFAEMPHPDAVSYETLIAAHGIAGDAVRAEELLQSMRSAGYQPQDYAYCGLIAAYSFHGDWKSALKVKDRMEQAGTQMSVHVYNALIAACDRAHQYEKALQLSREMQDIGVNANGVTQQLLEEICREGVKAVENQQAAIAALSAAVAAAGSVMIRAGIF